jgi:hypothetical protein
MVCFPACRRCHAIRQSPIHEGSRFDSNKRTCWFILFHGRAEFIREVGCPLKQTSREYAYDDHSPILYRFFYLLTPPSELPLLPASLRSKDATDLSTQVDTPPERPSYLPIHLYTVLQIVLTIIIFIVTLTKAAPAFPVLIIALVPFRLLLMKRWWPREVLRFVDAWACREGSPEDEEDERAKEMADGAESASVDIVDDPLRSEQRGAGGVLVGDIARGDQHGMGIISTSGNNAEGCIELDVQELRPHRDEEAGHYTK